MIGFEQIDAPFKGGTLVPAANVIVPGLPIDRAGTLEITSTWPPGVPPAFTIWFQEWITDSAGPAGFAASNGLSGTTP